MIHSSLSTDSSSRFSTRLFTLILSAVAIAMFSGCATEVLRGGEGTANPDLDADALSIKLDREDINYLVANYLEALEGSRFWMGDVQRATERPLMAIWPVQNATSQHIEDQLNTMLSSIETSLVNTGDVRVVDRSTQDALVREIGVQQGAAYDPATAQRLGRQLGVQYFVTGKITSVDERLNKRKRVTYSLFLQVLEVETGLIEFQNEVTRTKQVKG
ncbi:MAG: CsgG/HfaB family protein [Myxococcota bacterium]